MVLGAEGRLEAAFGAGLAVLLALDALWARRQKGAVKAREAAAGFLFWLAAASLFGVGVWRALGGERAVQFCAGYLLELGLSFDNMFVFLVLMTHFRVKAEERHRVLHWGVLGAVLLRLAFILAGIKLLNAFEPMTYVFGAFLLYTAWRMWRAPGGEAESEAGLATRLLRFFGEPSRLVAAVVAVELCDVIFALDSIPAVIAVTRDPFIVYSSNIFAVLGLRSLFFLVAAAAERMRYLHYALCALLAFMGLKMALAPFVDVSPGLSLAVVGGVLAAAAAAGAWMAPRPDGAKGPA